MNENIRIESVTYEIESKSIIIKYDGKNIVLPINTLIHEISNGEKEIVYKKYLSGEIYYCDNIQYGATFASNDTSKDVVVIFEDSNLEFDKYVRVIDSTGKVKQCEVRNLSPFDVEESYTYPYIVDRQYSSSAKITGSWCIVERSTGRLVAAYYFDNENQSSEAASMCYEALIFLTEQYNGN